MTVNKETLKKHHFWILVGVTPFLVLIAVIMITTGVGAAIEKKNGEITSARKAFQGKDIPKSDVFISRYGAQLNQLGGKRTDLWKENWERQIGLSTKVVGGKEVLVQDPSKNLLRWPKSKILDKFNYSSEYAPQLKFGDPIPETLGEDLEFRKVEVYAAEFSNPYMKDIAREPEKRTGMADKIYPTAFANGWTSVLRHVKFPATGPNGWGDYKPKPEQLWLALEDIWIQRSMLEAVKSVNDQIGAFYPVTRYDANRVKVEDTNLDRGFRSRVWLLSLKAAQRPGDGRFILTGTLSNMTDRLQLLGTGNTMVLNVWLSAAPNAQPIQFRIGGEFVPGLTTIPIVQSDEHVLPAGTIVEEIAKVEQVFDTRTVPIRRIERLALGFKDSRYAAAPLKSPLFASFKKEEEAATAAAAAGSGSGEGTGASPGGGPPPSGGKPGGPPGSGSGSGSGSSAVAGQMEGGGEVSSVIDGNRKRYLEVTQQVRRMPVAISLVVDQAYMQDVLLAYSNSPLRFQITQVHWQRFRGSLGDSGSGSSGTGGDGDISGPAKGYGGDGIKLGSGSGGPPRPGGLPGPMGLNPMGGGGPFSGGGTLTTISEGQLTAGLVELTVYGIVTLYEKYEASAPADAPK